MNEKLFEKLLNIDEDELIEALAELEHDQWMEWAKSLVKSEKLSSDRVERWEDLFVPYEDLSEDMKEEDRKYARKVFDILKQKANERKAI